MANKTTTTTRNGAPRKRRPQLNTDPNRHLHCKRCGHEWTPLYRRLPQTCCKCKSYHWQQPPTRKAPARSTGRATGTKLAA